MNQDPIMLWRNGRWVASTLKELPPHSHGKPEDCDRCNAEAYRLLSRISRTRADTSGRKEANK
jgi:hypothetical protein